MAEFIDRHKAVKDEKKIKNRLDTTIKYTKKKRYLDAADEDKKVIADSEKLETDLTNLQTFREGKVAYKTQKKENKARRRSAKSERKEKPAREGDFNFGDLAK